MNKIDPVCGMEVEEGKAAATSEYRGETYLFCATGCKRRFDENPDAYIGGPESRDDTISLQQPVLQDVPGGKTDRLVFRIGGMTCASCVQRVETAIRRVPGVVDAAVNLATESATVEFREGSADPGSVEKAVSSTGYTASAEADDEHEPDRQVRGLKRDLILSAVLTVPVLFINMFLSHGTHAWNYLLIPLTAPVLFWSGRRFFKGLRETLLHFSADMNTLIAVGSLSAFLYSVYATVYPDALISLNRVPATFYDTSAVIITLVLTGRYLEGGAKRKASEAIRRLQSLTPDMASVVAGGSERKIAVSDLAPGMEVRIRPGERIPADGVVIEGFSTIDQSTMTGESLPAEKSVADEVFGGTVNLTGTLLVEIRTSWKDSRLGKIVKSVAQTELSKVPVQRLADRIAAWFVPIVIGIAAVTFIYWYYLAQESTLTTALLSAVAVLTVACPCALGLATPTAIVVGKGAAALRGIIIKNLEKLETAHRVDLAVFDKTGTLTTGNISVAKMHATANRTTAEILASAASLEHFSEHPIGRAIGKAASESGIRLKAVDGFINLPGKGVQGNIEGIRFGVFSPNHLPPDISTDTKVSAVLRSASEEGQTSVCVIEDDRVVGIITLEDKPKEHAPRAVSMLRDMGIDSAMITGDNREVAARVGAEVGITQIYAGLLPDEKSRIIGEFQAKGRMVAMVGDGVNDAPALAMSDLGIALGSGTDIARETGDITIISDDLSTVGISIMIARRTMRIIRQNLFWAFVYNIGLIPLAAAGRLDPMVAAGAMALSSLTVVGNSLRLRNIKPD